jgi:hypothetical protein
MAMGSIRFVIMCAGCCIPSKKLTAPASVGMMMMMMMMLLPASGTAARTPSPKQHHTQKKGIRPSSWTTFPGSSIRGVD